MGGSARVAAFQPARAGSIVSIGCPLWSIIGSDVATAAEASGSNPRLGLLAPAPPSLRAPPPPFPTTASCRARSRSTASLTASVACGRARRRRPQTEFELSRPRAMHFPDIDHALWRAKSWLPLKQFLLSIKPEDVNQCFSSGSTSFMGWTPLAVACRHQFRDVVEALLQSGADPKQPTFAGSTATFVMCHEDTAAMLLDAGCPVNHQDDNGRTALMVAANHGRLGLLHLFLSRGADIDHCDAYGFNAESYAATIVDLNQSEGDIEGYCERKRNAMTLLADVRAAGSWEAYITYPRRSLLALRILCEQGRAKPSDALCDDHDLSARILAASTIEEAHSVARAFSPAPLGVIRALFPHHAPISKERPRESLRARTTKTDLPREVFWLILSFWRSDRDHERTPLLEVGLPPWVHDPTLFGHWRGDDTADSPDFTSDSDDDSIGSVSEWADPA